MDGIKFVDTTIRDGHQSLWAENMSTGMMLPVAERLDQAGFDAIELISSSHLKKCVRELKEDPWARVRLMRERVKRTPLRLNAGRFSAFDITPRSMYRLFMERMAANGIREARISEEWNELEGWRWKCEVAHDVGINPVPNIIYSVSPKHTDEYFAERTRHAALLDDTCGSDRAGIHAAAPRVCLSLRRLNHGSMSKAAWRSCPSLSSTPTFPAGKTLPATGTSACAASPREPT